MKTEKDIRRTLHGYGGLRCVCCNKWGISPRKSNPLERRLIRRVTRQNLKKEVDILLP